MLSAEAADECDVDAAGDEAEAGLVLVLLAPVLEEPGVTGVVVGVTGVVVTTPPVLLALPVEDPDPVGPVEAVRQAVLLLA